MWWSPDAFHVQIQEVAFGHGIGPTIHNVILAFEAAYQIGEKPVSAEMVESVLSRQIDDLEPTLTRNNYRLKDLVEQFDTKPVEIKALFGNPLDPTRASELRDKMLWAGLPI